MVLGNGIGWWPILIVGSNFGAIDVSPVGVDLFSLNDPDGYQWPPTFSNCSKQFSDNFGNLLFLAVLTSGAILRA
jgi:hypothetical protein